MLSPLFRRARERIPTLPSSVSLSFFLFSCTFSLAQCLLLVPCSSVFVRCSFNVSLTLFLSRSFSLLIGILSFSCHLLCSIHYPSSRPHYSLFSSDSSWRLSSFDCGSVTCLCALQGGLQGRRIKLLKTVMCCRHICFGISVYIFLVKYNNNMNDIHLKLIYI